MMIANLLQELPPGLFEYNVCQYLDPSSLIHLGSVNHALHDETSLDVHWKSLVAQQFGVALTPDRHLSSQFIIASKTLLRMPPPLPARTTCHHEMSSIRWRDVFQVALLDSCALAATKTDEDALSICKTHPQILLSHFETQLRNEIILMQGLRRFPLSTSLITLYAEMIRRKHLVDNANNIC